MRLEGPRRRLKRSRVAVVAAAMIAVTTAVLIHDLFAKFDSVRQFASLDHEWLSASTAATLLFASITIFITRRQFAAKENAYLRYTRGRRRPAPDSGPLRGSEDLWCVEVENDGDGLAFVVQITYDVELVGDPESGRQDVGFLEMLAVLESTGLRDELDFRVRDWQPGASLRPQRLRRLWEIPLPAARRIKTLTAHLHYRSPIGERHELTLDLIPPRGLPPEPES
jgi:hypothetical protein